MRKISLWARHHRFEAIACIVLFKFMLAAIAYYAGTALSDIGVRIPFAVLLIAMLLFLIAAVLYPSRDRQTKFSKKQFYTWQKSCDFLIAACSFIMIGTLVNSNESMTGTSHAYASAVITTITPTAEEILASLKYRDKSTLTRQEKRILKEEFKQQIKIYAVEKIKGNKDAAAKTALIILTIIGAVGLLYLVAALACTLSCNGSDAAAVAVLILGVAVVVWGTVVLVKRISRGKKRKDSPETGN